MKLCYIAQGNHALVKLWLSFFVQRGHEVYLITDKPAPIPGVQIYSLAMAGMKNPIRVIAKAATIRSILNHTKPDLLHVHNAGGYLWLGASVGFQPLVVTVWGSEVFTDPGPIKRVLRWLGLKRARLVTASSQAALEAAVRAGANPARCRLALWGVDLERFNPEAPTRVRDQLGIPWDTPVVLSMRKFRPLYNIDVLLHALQLVREAFARLHVIIQGWGEQEGYLRALTSELGLANIVYFSVPESPSGMPYDEVPGFLRAADVMVTVPSHDSAANTLLEAMACGVPIVAADLPAYREWITNGWNGLLVPARDVELLAQAIILLLGNEELRQVFSQRSYSIVAERADHRQAMKAIEDMYRLLIERHGSWVSSVRA